LIFVALRKASSYGISSDNQAVVTSADNSLLPLRPILITHEFDPFKGGVATYARHLGQALHALEPRFELWAPGAPSPSDPPFVRRLGGRISLRPLPLLTLAWNLARHRNELARADVILASIGAQMACMLLARAGLRPGRRRFCLWHGSEMLRFARDPLWSRLAPSYLAGIDGLFTASQFTRSRLDSRLFQGRIPPVTVIPCAASDDAAAPVSSAPAPEPGKIRILCLARLHPRKGQHDLIDALALLSPALKQTVVLDLAGTGDPAYARQLREQSAAAGIDIRFLGEIAPDRLAATYAGCDLYAMTSRTLPNSVEGFGITYLEAGLHGKPVVACDTGGVGEAVRNEVTGLLVEEGNTAALAEALARLITDPSLRHRLGEGNRAHAATFSWQASARTLLRALGHNAAAG
jgi:phosphatidylinositol alpha-1,6-mannosyltransferase